MFRNSPVRKNNKKSNWVKAIFILVYNNSVIKSWKSTGPVLGCKSMK